MSDLKAPFPWFGLGLPANVEAKIGSLGECGCWNWLAAKTNGYGVVQHQGRVQRAHRVVYETLIGPIPAGLELDHLCRNRSCVNPVHLEPVSGAENIARGESMSAIHARQTHCKRGHELSKENVYLRRRGALIERFCRACSRLRDAQRYARRKSAMEVELCKH